MSLRSGGQATPAEKKANWFRLVFYKSAFRPAPAGRQRLQKKKRTGSGLYFTSQPFAPLRRVAFDFVGAGPCACPDLICHSERSEKSMF
ncbi:MAG: hypothetical protein COV66_07985 [Nitrospinae bacterium CG11_big_fil_rev_8_21_14_0_20_45_15]|nr:MAG: hypothetical protein COV66_07985 [Nitrospinae bacterium CG11_big_fil_rev_8_21_14_0_20_45_15]